MVRHDGPRFGSDFAQHPGIFDNRLLKKALASKACLPHFGKCWLDNNSESVGRDQVIACGGGGWRGAPHVVD